MTIDIDDAINALLAYQQADMEGTMVLTSRQAIHEVANEIRRIRADAQSSQVTDAMVNAAAREMWNDRDARMGGPWEGRSPGEVCVVQTKATARAALEAALAAQPPAAPVETKAYKCGAGCRGACNWPICECDPHANEIKQALIDDGWTPEAPPQCSAERAQALRLLMAEDERQSKLHDLLETIREQIRTGVDPEHRPEGLFKNIQDAVYAMRGRTRLMDDAAITHIFDEPQPTQVTADQAAEDVRREREAKAERDRYAKMTTAEKCAVQGDGFINDYD